MPTCIFCNYAEKDRILFETGRFIVVYSYRPVNPGHVLIIPKRHMLDPFGLSLWEWLCLKAVIFRTKSELDRLHHPDGYNIGVNCGVSAGQSVFHLHIHVIPRFTGDDPDSPGGVRKVKKPLDEHK